MERSLGTETQGLRLPREPAGEGGQVVAASGSKKLILQKVMGNEFDVATGDFADLVVQGRDDFHYIYDDAGERLIKSFLLRQGQQVDTLCDVVLTGEPGALTPRLRVWKKDKTKPGNQVDQEVVTGEVGVLAKALVDLGDCAGALWRLVGFLQSVEGICLPGEEFRVTSAPSAKLLDAFEGHGEAAVLAAVQTHLDGDLTEQDVQMLVNRRRTLERFGRLLDEDGFIEVERHRLQVDGLEGVWQSFFEDNTWIFGYGLTLVACEAVSDAGLEAITSGANVFTGGANGSTPLCGPVGSFRVLSSPRSSATTLRCSWQRSTGSRTCTRSPVKSAVQSPRSRRPATRRSRSCRTCIASTRTRESSSSRSPRSLHGKS